MKHVMFMLAIMAAFVSYSSTVLAEEDTMGQPNEYGQYKASEMKSKKDECLVVAKNCMGSTDNVMQRVERLNREIDKGTAVYTPEELKSLQDQLNWIKSEGEETSRGIY